MDKRQLPWVLRGSDFSKKDWHVAYTAGFQLMFEFLRISPSYELARKQRTRGLSQREVASLPGDFDQVLKTYDLIGDVSADFFALGGLSEDCKYSAIHIRSREFIPLVY